VRVVRLAPSAVQRFLRISGFMRGLDSIRGHGGVGRPVSHPNPRGDQQEEKHAAGNDEGPKIICLAGGSLTAWIGDKIRPRAQAAAAACSSGSGCGTTFLAWEHGRHIPACLAAIGPMKGSIIVLRW
jgi:hypothetical protein